MATLAPQRRVAVSPVFVLGALILVGAIWLAVANIGGSFRTYVTTIQEATSTERSVQLAGFLGSTGEIDTEGNFTFLLQDERGELIQVVYAKPRPANFEQAISVVAIGHYDRAANVFIADDLLVKCPSKYQEQLQ